MLDSKLVRDALDFTLSNNEVRKRIDPRDADKRILIEEIKIKRYKYDNGESNAIFRVGLDYTTMDQSAPEKEDVMIDLAWDNENGFKLRRIKSFEEI